QSFMATAISVQHATLTLRSPAARQPRPEGSFPRAVGTFPRPGGTLPCPEGTFPRAEGAFPCPEGTFPCPEGTLPRPEGTLPCAEGTLPGPEGTFPRDVAGGFSGALTPTFPDGARNAHCGPLLMDVPGVQPAWWRNDTVHT